MKDNGYKSYKYNLGIKGQYMELEQKVLSIVNKIARKNVELGDELLKKNLIDSITTVDLILELQEEFDCYIPATDAESILETPKSIINYLNNLK
ncbi:hypothetical protein CKY01_17170 [Photorhabdus laumondii subsp. clarkei]|uniref:Carrier domain-containing protein n=1 Tax=Photorhabdus laumondii subsp. clarkei TaxID=2029685 RepID=A0A329VBH9_9GAMM|nr:hypothetical protein CKY01_17170 [Photorhabdus laumondii subsp. clarkei]